jgi:hypothetical protein
MASHKKWHAACTHDFEQRDQAQDIFDDTVTIKGTKPPSAPVNQRYIHLIKASSNITRPFIYRNKTLIASARDLVTLYNASNDAKVHNQGVVSK